MTRHQLNFSIPPLPQKWRSKIGVRQRVRGGPSCFPVGANGVSTLPVSPSPWALLPWSLAHTWPLQAFTHTRAHAVDEEDQLAQGHLERQRPFWSVIWTLSLYTQHLLGFHLGISGRTHCFENNLKVFRTDFQNNRFFSFVNSTVKVSSKPFDTC